MNESKYNAGEKTLRVCIVSFPMPSVLVVNALLYNLVEILEPICEEVYVVSSNIPKDRTFSEKIRIHDVKTAMHSRENIHPMWWSTLLQLLKIIIIQMKICLVLTKISKEIDIVIFYAGGPNLFPSVIITKLLKKKIVVLAAGSATRLMYKLIIRYTIETLEKISFGFADLIVLHSDGVIYFRLNDYRKNINTSGARYIDTNLFRINKNLRQRRDLIGYIGRFTKNKRVMNFIEAFPIILKKRENIGFLIGGGGVLFNEIEEKIKNSEYANTNITLTGWIPHEKLPNYLNELKLLVLPADSEGMPTIIIEAMACGTPVLATPVGGVPDVLRDEDTGFILEDNSPECIAKDIIRVLNHPNLEEIVKNSRKLIDEEYTHDAAVERYKKILSDL